MIFLKFLERGGLPVDSGLSDAACRLGAAVLQSAGSLADFIDGGIPEALSSFDSASMRALGEAHRAWRRWQEALDEIDEAPLREWAEEHTFQPEQARFLAEVDPSVDDAPELLDLFCAALAVSRTHGSVKVGIGAAGAPAAGSDDPYDEVRGRRFSLAEMGPSRWLVILQGLADKALTVEFAPNLDAIKEDLADRGEAAAAKLVTDVGPTLPEALEAVLDEQAHIAVVRSAANQYISLLRSRILRAETVLAIYVGRARDPLGLALLGRDGKLRHQAVIHAGPDWGKRLERFVLDHDPEQAVLPSDGPAPRMLQGVARRLPPRLPATRVRRAALDLARRTLTDIPKDLPPVVQAAVALGRRALDPAGEWGRLDADKISLVDHQELVSAKRLTEALLEARLTRTAGGPLGVPRTPSKTATADAASPAVPTTGNVGGSSSGGRRRVVVEPPRARGGRGRSTLSRRKVEVVGDDTEVKTLLDLRPGLHVRGTVTNTSRFGAFVALGLPEEGLIHVSELADQYVADPGEIVSVGQELIARVIQVDTDRKRVSLSLKDVDPAIVAAAPPPPPPPPPAESPDFPTNAPGAPDAPPGAGTGPLRSGVPQNRSQALAELNRLFKE